MDYDNNTQETVYNIIYSVVFGGMHGNTIEYPKLNAFIEELFNLNKIAVYPFDEFETAKIRFICKINWFNVYTEYKNKNIDLANEDFDLEEYTTRLYSYVHSLGKYQEEKTRG